MLSAGAWKLSQQNLITFVLVDSSGVEVTGLGSSFTLQLSKAGGAFGNSAGTKAEIGSGWYSYLSTSGESSEIGPIAIKVTHASTVQQNLEYCIEERTVEAVEFTYTVTDIVSGDPLDGVRIWISTNAGGTAIVWSGFTDALGVARDDQGALPRLDPGTYYIFRQVAGYTFTDPDTEVVA